MNKTDLIVFSKDRPSQLNTLLRSIELNSNNLFNSINVILTWSKPEFYEGYRKLFKLHPLVQWTIEKGFRYTTIEMIKNSSEFICMMVDDDVFYRKSNLQSQLIIDLLNNIPNSVFSLRLGTNITVGDNFTNQPVIQPHFSELQLGNEKIGLFWKNENYHSPFHYPVSLDAHIFKKDWLLRRSQEIEFKTPNFYEGSLIKFGNEFEHIVSPVESCVTSIPCNRVQAEFENKTIGEISAEGLNKKWLDGEEIDLTDLMKNSCNSTHSNWSYKFI